jgi:hypothetical protein
MLNGNWDDLPLQSPPQTPPLQQQPSGSANHSQILNNGQFNMSQMQQDSNGFFSPRQSPVDAITTSSPTGSICNEALQLRLDRESDGRCADCGAQTHEVHFDPSGSGRTMKAPLSVPGVVHRGRCLFCHPLPASLSRKRVKSNCPPPQAFDALNQQPQHMPSRRPRRRSTVSSDQHLSLKRPSLSRDQPQTRSPNQPSLCIDLTLPMPPARPSSSLSDNQGYRREFGNCTHSYRENISCSASESDNHSIYSHQSASVWSGCQQHQPLQHQAVQTESQLSADFVEKYQQQKQLIEQMETQLQLQQAKNLDDGSVSQQSFHSLHSQQSIHSQAYNPHLSSPPPVWSGGQQHQPLQHQAIQTKFELSADFVEKYQQQKQLIEKIQTQLQLQQGKNLDDGSVSQQSFHSFHSQQLIPSQAYNPHLSSPQSLSTDHIESQFPLSISVKLPIHSVNNVNEYECTAAAAICQQMKDEPNLDFGTYLQAMRQFPFYAFIQETALINLLPQIENVEVSQAIGNVGGISIILDAICNHPYHVTIQRTGCESVRLLCTHPHNRQVIMQSSGIQLLVKMMSCHVNDTDLQCSGCKALASVAEGGMEYKIAVAQGGGILVVMKAVEVHPENNALLTAAYQALRTLGYNPASKSG